MPPVNTVAILKKIKYQTNICMFFLKCSLLMLYVHGYELKWIISSLSIDPNETECENLDFRRI